MPAKRRRASCKRFREQAAGCTRAANIGRRSTRFSPSSCHTPTWATRLNRRTAVPAIHEALLGLLKTWTRTTSFIGKDVTEVVRRPGALFSLIFGPFLIMGLFGLAYSGQYRPLNAILVVPQDAQLPRDPAFYEQFTGDSVRLLSVDDDVEAARARLRRQEIDLIVIAPPNVGQNFLNGQQSTIAIEYNELGPVRDN